MTNPEDDSTSGCDAPCTNDWWSPPPYEVECDATPAPGPDPAPVMCQYHEMFMNCDTDQDEKLHAAEAASCFDTNCDALCAGSTDCYCAGLDTTNLVTLYDTDQSSSLTSEEWCSAWEAVVDGNSLLPPKPDDQPDMVCSHNNMAADGSEIFDKDGDPWGC